MKITKARADAILRAIDKWEDRPLPEDKQEGYQTLQAHFSRYLEREGFGPDSGESYIVCEDPVEGTYAIRYMEGAWRLVGFGFQIQSFETSHDLFTFVRKAIR